MLSCGKCKTLETLSGKVLSIHKFVLTVGDLVVASEAVCAVAPAGAAEVLFEGEEEEEEGTSIEGPAATGTRKGMGAMGAV